MADLFVPQSGDHGTNQAIAALIEHVVALEGPASAPVEAPVELSLIHISEPTR